MRTANIPIIFLFLALLSLIFLNVFSFSNAKVDNNPSEEIKNVVEDFYIKGLHIRDFNLIKTICIPEAKLMSVGKDGKLHVISLDQWSKRFDPENPPFTSLDYQISKVDCKGTAAQVRIDFLVDSSQAITDFLHLLKINDKWSIVNIIDY